MTRPSTALALAVAALAAATLFMVLPVGVDRSLIVWEPESADDGGSLRLTRTTPERVDVDTTCSLVRSGDVQPLARVGELTLTLRHGELSVVTEPHGRAAEVDLPRGDCDVHVRYDDATGVLGVTAGPEEDEVSAPAPVISRLSSDPLAVDRVEVLTRATGVRSSWLRAAVGLLALALAGAAVVASGAVGRRRRPRVADLRRAMTSLAPVDAAVAIALLALAFVIPAVFDDGWVLARAGSWWERKWFGNVYTNNDGWLPQAFPHEALFAGLAGLGAQYIHLRLVAAAAVMATWLVLRLAVLRPLLGDGASRWLPVAAVYVAFAGAWLTSIRPEPFVALLGAVCLAGCLAMRRRPSAGALLLVMLTAGLAMVTHQSGWVTVGLVLLTLKDGFAAVRARTMTRTAVAVPLLVSTAVVLVVAFVAADWSILREGAGDFSSDSAYSGVLQELYRYQLLLLGPAGRVATILFLAVLTVMAAVGTGGLTPPQRHLWSASMLWLLGLVLTSSKWEWHLGLYIVPATVFAALTGHGLRDGRRDGFPGWALLLPIVTLAAGVSLSSPGPWGNGDLLVYTWEEFGAAFADADARRWWYLVFAVALALGLLADRGRRRAASVALSVALLLPLALTVVWLVRDAAGGGLTQLDANVRQLNGGNRCGVLDGRPLLVDADALLRMRAGHSPDRGDGRLARDAYFPVDGLVAGPFSGNVPVWGSWFAPDGQATNDAFTGLLRSPEYRVAGAEQLVLWTAVGAPGAAEAHVVFGRDGKDLRETELPTESTTAWDVHRVRVPGDAETVRVEVEDLSPGYGGWGAVSAPATPVEETAEQVLTASPGFVGAFDYPTFPCVELPDLGDGYWKHWDHQVPDPLFDAFTNLPGSTRTELFCRRDDTCLEAVDYDEAVVEVQEG